MAAATALVVLLVVLIRALYTQFFGYQQLRDVRQIQQDALVRMVADDLDEKIDSRRVALRRLSSELATILSRTAEMRRVADSVVNADDTFNAVFVARPNGEMIFSTAVPEGVRVQLADRDYFQQIKQGAPFAISGLIQGKLTSAPGIVLAVPMLAQDGSLRAVVGGILKLSANNFLRQLARSRVGVTGFYCLVSDGPKPRYIMHPDNARIMAPARALGESCGMDARESRLEVFMPTQPVVSRYLLSASGWEVVAVLPAAEAFAPLTDSHKRVLVLSLVLVLGAAGLMWTAMWRLLAPLKRLRMAMRQAAANPGALQSLPMERHDEIGELANTFADVVQQLSEHSAALQVAKDRAAESEKRIEAIANHVPDFVAFAEAGERIVFVNHAYGRHFGMPPQQLIGLSLRELWGTPEYMACQPYLAQAYGGTAVTFTRESADGAECMEITYQPAWNDAQDTVQGIHIFARNVTDERQKLRTLEAQTVSDHLTGLLNRKGFDRRLTDTMARAGTNGQPAALLLVDLDDFKAVNDSFGHSVGDRLLVAFAQRLLASVRKGDAVARIGGDEFAVILDNVGNPLTVERLSATIVQAALQPIVIDGHSFVASASVGSAIHHPERAISVSELFMRADMALYEAKRHGKGRYTAPLAAALP